MADIKQIIVMRTLYPDGKGGTRKLRTGKLCAQAAHASMKVFFDRLDVQYAWRCGQTGTLVEPEDDAQNPGNPVLLLYPSEVEQAWLEGVFTKVVCYVETEDELRSLYQKAQEAKLPCSLIEDSGATEFDGVPTVTCIAIGPAKSEDLAPITGSLSLL